MRRLPALAALLLGLGGLLAPAQAAAPSADEVSAQCTKCHDEDDLPDMSLSPHAPKKAPMKAAAEAMRGTPMAMHADPRTPACTSCHGDSSAHMNKPAGAAKRALPDRVFRATSPTPPHERNEACLTCHRRDHERTLWEGSAHEAADVPCTSCHQVHTNHDKSLAKATQTEVCFNCHKEQRAQMQRPSHHPVPEGRMACADCHNVHGSAGAKLVKGDNTNDTCYGCHADKRGPFVHQHEPVVEDCANCHNPHGSTVAGLLKARAPILCQQCHTPHVAGGVGAVAGQPGVALSNVTGGKNVVTMWQGRSCTNCHTQVHGSNNPSATNPTPQFLFR
jgi:DmsE family decaheme c-type cytochrome